MSGPHPVGCGRLDLSHSGEVGRARHPSSWLGIGTAAFALLAEQARRRQRITYADFAFELGLGSPRQLGWLLTPLLRWCEARGLPPLPIIVVRRADGLPSGGYDLAAVASETERVFAHDWARATPPGAADLHPFATLRLPPGLRARAARHLGTAP